MQPLTKAFCVLATTMILITLCGCRCGPKMGFGGCGLASMCNGCGQASCCSDSSGTSCGGGCGPAAGCGAACGGSECGPSCGGGCATPCSAGGSGCAAASSACSGCVATGKMRPMAWLHRRWSTRSSRRWKGSGCGDVYMCAWKSDPPDYCDPCDRCGQWTEPACCQSNCWKDLMVRPLNRLSCKSGGCQGVATCSATTACGCGTACHSPTGCDGGCSNEGGGCASGSCDGSSANTVRSVPWEDAPPWQEYPAEETYPEYNHGEILSAPKSAARPQRLPTRRTARAKPQNQRRAVR